MQGLGAIGSSDPMNALAAAPAAAIVALVLALAALISLTLLVRNRRRQSADPLGGLFSPERLKAEIEASERRASAPRSRNASHGALLRGQIDHLHQIETLWGRDAHAEAVRTTAQIMRAGVRKSDSVRETGGRDGDSAFEIYAHGASEKDAGEIAKRLRRTISRTKVAGMGDAMRLTASFGVASRRFGESEAAWRARADAALQAAHAWGCDRVVTASEWEEILLLPPPSDCEKNGPADTTRAA